MITQENRVVSPFPPLPGPLTPMATVWDAAMTRVLWPASASGRTGFARSGMAAGDGAGI